MKQSTWVIRLEETSDTSEIEQLQAEAFGPGRFVRTAFQVRKDVPHRPDLSFVGLSGSDIAGSIRLTPIHIGETPALLLGPLTVSPAFKNRGLGKLLLQIALNAVEAAGDRIVLLVGDAPYYGPFGFEQVPMGKITLPGPVDPARLLVARLKGADMPDGAVSATMRTA
ncbi:N-acetyltransferase [Roseibium denhamense]|uniref:Predicted N-acetyltransferase YhbS n=1 Tax=Roseibium denhamense TaxID=76305 RepID=A0ABY1NGX4_9HYPH|nr:N-acetyltransferase [Roseibium denhamense]MTI06352.1 N-acetyltransferase [Roseibium denhamense]SMP08512.1 Predicted N-acetyltransferase YhbS [Roseibium denhamense]